MFGCPTCWEKPGVCQCDDDSYTPVKTTKFSSRDTKENLRRSCERGLRIAQASDEKFIDIFQHMLDEISRLE